MKNKFLIVLAATVLAVGGLTAIKASAASREKPHHARNRVMERIAGKLDLTAEQRKEIRGILAGEKNTLKALASRSHEARADLRAAIRANDATETSVRAASAKVSAVDADLAVERMKLFEKIKPLLTEEQLKKISELEKRANAFAESAIDQIGSSVDN